jgi:hypothetical protein
MAELDRFEGYRYVGDKRIQVVYDLEHPPAPEVLRDLMASEEFICFGPDMLFEARNRGYHPDRAAARAAKQEAEGPAATG